VVVARNLVLVAAAIAAVVTVWKLPERADADAASSSA
jgi:hypothetical protein